MRLPRMAAARPWTDVSSRVGVISTVVVAMMCLLAPSLRTRVHLSSFFGLVLEWGLLPRCTSAGLLISGTERRVINSVFLAGAVVQVTARVPARARWDHYRRGNGTCHCSPTVDGSRFRYGVGVATDPGAGSTPS